ncbi:hypothetical protein [uncultured Roseibium sp.]|uniref:hypothetical protein n=1 Tax=uncultured Roseibium sp. TaxID=1936171 RepID=UPI002622B364|nr:hypothetical protein [uncultured Roseibium sp.]
MRLTAGLLDDEERTKAAEIAAHTVTHWKGALDDDFLIVCRQLLHALKRDAANRHLVDGNEDIQRREARAAANRELAKRRCLI